jgi:hypothetical protein
MCEVRSSLRKWPSEVESMMRVVMGLGVLLFVALVVFALVSTL